MKFADKVAATFARMDGDDDVWVFFEEGLKPESLRRADLEYAEKKSEDDVIELDLERYLWDCERALEGDLLALFDVVGHCQELQTPLPYWAAERIQKMIANGVLGQPVEPKTKGRHGTSSKVLADELKGHLRHDAVSRVRVYQTLGPCLFSFMMLPVGLRRIYSGKPLPDFGHTVDEAIEAARQSLSGSFAQCSFETLRKAYRNEKNAASPSWAAASDDALIAIGVEVDQEQYLPEHQSHSFLPHIPNLPSQMGVEVHPTKLDERSLRIIEEAKGFSDFNDFVRAVQDRKVVL
ncbi:hypothetical protein E4Z66_03555 [Aliishimia ponticola]|uniref:Uncharacterized protein n=1 Tax=Aliishimia ponticola TaxID=2499833 RepID=A0A4S4NIU1_9RHOB|nr:hypothetical protein [Aliishimia ponticola]THH38657.1 hypothetical protein E4Z66_03555 [Aliishimia ponticola]